jgi:pilus assembly protein CpaD
MTRQPRPVAPLRRRIATLLLTTLAAAACTPLAPPPTPALPQPRAVAVEYGHVVHFETDRAALTADEARGIRAFLDTLPRDRRLMARIVGHADQRASSAHNHNLSARRAAAVAEVVRAAGYAPAAVTTVAVGESFSTAAPGNRRGLARDRQVEILLRGDEIVLPGCPDWSRDPGFDPLNLPLSNLGCANAVNFGLMVADPADLRFGHPTAPADGVREAEAVTRYRSDKVRPLDAEVIQ